jgi:hypothetical protein
MKRTRLPLVMVAFLLAWLSVACDEPIATQTESRTVEAGGARTAQVDLRMGAGELRVTGASQEALLEAAFKYNRERLRPDVEYHVSGEKGYLRVGTRRSSGVHFGRVRNEWDLSLTRSLPVDLRVNLGAGENRLDLRGVDLTNVDIDMGVGDMRLDLRGPRTKSFRVSINGGVGSGTLYLPSDVGVRVRVDGGLGSVNTRGLMKDHHAYTNDAYGRSDVTIDVDISAGIGSLDLRVGSGERARF